MYEGPAVAFMLSCLRARRDHDPALRITRAFLNTDHVFVKLQQHGMLLTCEDYKASRVALGTKMASALALWFSALISWFLTLISVSRYPGVRPRPEGFGLGLKIQCHIIKYRSRLG